MNVKLSINLGLLALNIAGFAISLGGLIGLQAGCASEGQPKIIGDGGLLDPSLSCSGFHQYQWFKVLFQGFILFLNMVILILGFMPVFATVISIMRALSSVLMMDAANDYLGPLRTSTGGLERYSAVFFAGLIVSIVANLLMIVLVSSKWHLISRVPVQKDNKQQPASDRPSQRKKQAASAPDGAANEPPPEV